MRTIGISIIVLVVIAALTYILIQCSFTGKLDKKVTREDLGKNFLDHESEFVKVTEYFDFLTSAQKQDQKINFGLSKKNRFNLFVSPLVVTINNQDQILGGDNLKIDSPEMTAALTKLRWKPEAVLKLRGLLSKTGCEYITTTGIQFDPIKMYNTPSGWSNFHYLVFKEPLNGTLIERYGPPVSSNGFGRHVVIVYTSAL
jgi:hypothetical protein